MKTNEIIRIRRQELGLTLKDIANACEVSEATVSRWESGDIRNLKRGRIGALSRALDIPPAVLMDWQSYDDERIKRDNLIKEFTTLANVADINNIEIALDLLKRLEGK